MSGNAFDVIVVGARAAGAPTAMLLARRGHRVLLLDRDRFPSDTLSTLYIQQPGVARLARWGLLDAVRATGCPPLDRVVYDLGDVRVEGCSTGVDGQREAYAPRRHLLDGILAEGAVAAGVEFRPGCEVTALERAEDGRVTGVVHRPRGGGAPVTERARLVVGADGMRSAVAALAGTRTTVEHPRLTCAYYMFWTGVPAGFEMYEGATGWIAAVPTNDALLVAAYHPQHRFEEVRRDAKAAYLDAVRVNAPQLWERLGAGERLDRLHGTGDQQNFFRVADADGVVLVGDAGHHKDSLTAQGITDAMVQAEMLDARIGDVLHDDAALREGLRAFVEERDQRFMPNFQATLMVARAEGRDQRRALLTAVGSDPGHTQRYFDALAGVIPLHQLYTPGLQALLGRGAA